MQYVDDDFKGKKILITGGAGFIGSNLAMYFQKHHPKAEVIVFDCFRSEETFSNGNLKSLGHFKNLLDFKGEVIAGNINNKKDLELLEKFDFDYIFHEAAISDTTVMDQESVLRSNVNAFKSLLNLAFKHKAQMIYASSAGVYGNTPAPNSIGAGEIPENVYGFSKLMMDNLAMKFAKEHKIIGLRYFNVYGENECHKGKTASMILQLGLQALKNKKVRLFKMGEQKRDFVYIQDVVQANIKATQAHKSGIYNVGSGVARSYNDIVNALKMELGEFEVEYFENPYKFFQNHTEANITLTKKFLDYEPRFSLEIGIKNYLSQIKQLHSQGFSI
ncbi:ADP-glyceromanno-heptose 6-epimerase [Helicobacter valdiviensis]|uniref:ADP-glyceromanno-heptose 6-epimerase n=1 Tax=Helicobacter valdiviensis TaxID=1458358 RepID=A0A2W6MSN7_9HELI|nr:ADP-glyceromanno-heptose 6-epimerase [Helicobacter valdiviensis]PZT47432.1 ADP-glyceromanno-heptose 6-epimerase [Helicobacter valdiviensis]